MLIIVVYDHLKFKFHKYQSQLNQSVFMYKKEMEFQTGISLTYTIGGKKSEKEKYCWKWDIVGKIDKYFIIFRN